MRTPAPARTLPAIFAIKSVLLPGILAALVAAPAASAPPDASDPKDVTITVVTDPEQLNEKVNRISLPPGLEEPAHASPTPGKNADQSKDTDAAREKAAHDADVIKHETSGTSQDDAEGVKQDTADAPQQGPDHAEDAGGG